MITSLRNVIQQWRRTVRWAKMPIVRQPLRHALHHSIITWERGHVRAAVIELGEGAAELATGAGDIDTHDLIMADASSSALRSPDIPSCISRVF